MLLKKYSTRNVRGGEMLIEIEKPRRHVNQVEKWTRGPFLPYLGSHFQHKK